MKTLKRESQSVAASLRQDRVAKTPPAGGARVQARAHKIIARCSHALVRATDERQLLNEICRVVVDSGGYRVAWVGLVRHDEAKTIEPVASAGDEDDYLSSIKLSWADNNAYGRGPAGMAVRTGKPQAVRDVLTNPNFVAWREQALKRGFKVLASLPLVSDGETLGVFGIFADESSALDESELALLGELAQDMAYGIGNLRRRVAQERADLLLRLEHTVTRSLAEADNLSAAMKQVIRAVCETEDWECGRFLRVDDGAAVLRLEESWGIADPAIAHFLASSRSVSYARGTGLAGTVWETGQTLWIPDVEKDGRAKQLGLISQLGLRGTIFFPVISDGETLGVLAFNSHEIRQPDERLMRAVRVIGSQLGQFLRRKRAEEVLRESEARFRSLTQLSSDIYWEQDQHFRFTVMTGTELGSIDVRDFPLFGKKRWEIEYFNIRGDDWKEHIETLEAHRPFHDLELCRLNSAGKKIWLSISGEPVFDAAGAFKGYRGVGKDITERKEAEVRLAYFAQYDSLTDLPNRHLFHDRLVHTMAQARRSGRPMAVLFIDLDRFKLVNDTLGHRAGDDLLKQAAARLEQCVRASDTVGRFGGDEFGAIVSDLGRPADASVVAEKIIRALAQPFDVDGHETFISASVGITLFPHDGVEAGVLIMNADAAMYRAKEQGRNNFQYFTPEMNERARERVHLEAALRRALERREFLLHYQPKIDVRSRAVCGLEALLRWRHPEKGLVSPAEFIPVLEDTGLIVPVGEWVMEAVCAQIRDWQRAGIACPPVAINLSARQFQQKDLEATVRRILGESGVAAPLLEFELTESMLMKDPEAAERTLRRLKEAGVTISIDDFGTGYSSLAYLKRFSIDALKIDRAFIRDVTADPDDAAITLAIIGLAHSLKLKVVAEGVETQAQFDFLSTRSCDEMQGFLFARPLPVEECTRALTSGRLAKAD